MRARSFDLKRQTNGWVITEDQDARIDLRQWLAGDTYIAYWNDLSRLLRQCVTSSLHAWADWSHGDGDVWIEYLIFVFLSKLPHTL